MVTTDTTEVTTPLQGQASTAENLQAQVESAQVNQGNTVRASWNFSLDSIVANTSHMSTEARDLLRWAFTWCIDPAHPIRLDEMAERIGFDRTTVWKWYVGKYYHPTQKTERGAQVRMDLSAKAIGALRNFKRVEISRSKLGRQKFVITPTARKVFQACDLARESQTPVFVEGASHIGKTEAFRQYCIENNHGKSILIELEGVNGQQGLIRAVAAKLGIGGGNISDLMDRVKRAVTSDMVIIFDEVHLLANTYRRTSFFGCMEWIRRLYDATQCGIVLSFTKLGFNTTEKERKRELEQIFRRGVHRMNLGEMPTVADVKLIVGAWGLEIPARQETVTITLGRQELTEAPYAMLAQLARESGLKSITERLRYAAKFSADEEADLAWDHVLKAHFTITRNGVAPDHGWQH